METALSFPAAQTQIYTEIILNTALFGLLAQDAY